MHPSRFLTAPTIFLCMLSNTYASEPLVVLGLPLGSQLAEMPKNCVKIGAIPKKICWVDSPNIYKGTRTGMAALPAPDSRPRWAAYALFDLQVARDRTLDKIEVSTLPPTNRNDIVNSISSRFGHPTLLGPQGPTTYSATWDLPEIHVYLLCSSDKCHVAFSSAKEHAELARQLAERSKIDAKRPISP